MNVDTIAGATAWLLAWGNLPRRGILRATIAGLETARAIDRAYRRDTSEIDGTLAILRQA